MRNKDILFIDYGVIEEILIMYKIGKITLDEAKRLIKFQLK
jgi:hypothetical protein